MNEITPELMQARIDSLRERARKEEAARAVLLRSVKAVEAATGQFMNSSLQPAELKEGQTPIKFEEMFAGYYDNETEPRFLAFSEAEARDIIKEYYDDEHCLAWQVFPITRVPSKREAELEAEVERLKAGLEIYADKSNWSVSDGERRFQYRYTLRDLSSGWHYAKHVLESI
jgi:hypothetical protein